MKKIFSLITLCLFSVCLMAQTKQTKKSKKIAKPSLQTEQKAQSFQALQTLPKITASAGKVSVAVKASMLPVLIASNTSEKIKDYTAVYDNCSCFDKGEFKAPRDGNYLVSAQLSFAALVNSNQITIKVNDIADTWTLTSATASTANITGFIRLKKDDKLKVQVQQNSGSPQVINNALSSFSILEIPEAY